MSDEPEPPPTPRLPAANVPTLDDGQPGSGLPSPVREHLGQQLRTTYHALADKPAFLGDPAVPLEFEQHLQRLEIRERVHEQGVKAVEAALGDLGAGLMDPDELRPESNPDEER